jgi:hypothetical protein
MLLADVSENAAPADPFKTIHEKQEKKTQVHEKITRINHFEGTEDAEYDGPGKLSNKISRVQSHNYRWTTVENQFTKKKKRLFDELP